MKNKELVDYIHDSLERGSLESEVRTALSRNGWGESEIDDGFKHVQKTTVPETDILEVPAAPSKQKNEGIGLRDLSASQILLYLGGLIVVLAGIIYIGISWSEWGPIARIFAIFLPMMICYCAGFLLWFLNQSREQAIAFVVTGSLLFPLFLSIGFKELGLFAQPFSDGFGLSVSLLTFLLYVALSFIFRFPIWSFLYHSVGLFVYYYFAKVLGVNGFESTTLAWLFLILGTLYLFSSLLYWRSGKEKESHYVYVVGTIVLVLAFVRLFLETIEEKHLAWILLVFGVGYFVLGLWLESQKEKRHCQTPYLVGVAVLFFSLVRLGIDGTLLKGIVGPIEVARDIIVGWSNVVIGTIFLTSGWGIAKVKKFQLEEGAHYKEFFDLVGPLFILGSFWYLGLGGVKPIYETLLLLSSLGFIFGSIPNLSRQYLYTGTLFLVIYIFAIGGEYFQHDVGWPLTLFVAGFVSMGIGVAIEIIRRKYFLGKK